MSDRHREIGVWLAAGADVFLGFLLARYGPAWFGIGEALAVALGIGIAVLSVGSALWMTSRRRRAGE